jgi:hypothetical protein
MNIAITAGEPQAKPDSNAVIKAGGGLPITITFDVSPGSSPVIEVALSTQSSSATELAYLDTFDQQDSLTFTGTLNTNDSRLLAALVGFQTITVNVEVRWTIGENEPTVCPNFPLTVQPPLLTGPGSSEGGPVYVTTAMQAAALAAAMAALAWSQETLALSAAGTTDITNSATWLTGRAPVTAGAGSGAYVADLTLDHANALAGAILRILIDFAASGNPTINIYDGTTGGTLLEGPLVNPTSGVAASFLFIAGFDGAAWHKESGQWIT